MKCPVCDRENSTMLCPQCGFDASRDYERYPSFCAVSSRPSVSAMRRDWYMQDQEKLDQISALLSALLAVRYLKLIEEDPYVHAAYLCLHTLTAELDREKKASRQALIRNQELLADLTVSSMYSENATQEQKKLEDKIRKLVRLKSAFMHRNNALEQDIQNYKVMNDNLSRDNESLVLSVRELETKVSELEAALKASNAKNTELEAALEVERNKGVIARLFNR